MESRGYWKKEPEQSLEHISTSSHTPAEAAASTEASAQSSMPTFFAIQGSLLQVATNHLFEAIIVTDLHGKVLLANDKVYEFTGLSAEQLVYDYERQFLASTANHIALPRDELPLAKALRGLETREARLTFQLHDRDITILANAGPIYDSQHRIMGGMVLFRDISRRTFAARRTQLLKDLDVLLVSGRVDVETLQTICQMVSEVLGAWSVLGLTHDGDQAVEIVSCYHPDNEQRVVLTDLVHQIPVLIGGQLTPGTVVLSDRPQLNRRLPSKETLSGMDPKAAELFRRMGGGSLLTVPLSSRGHTLGILMLVSLPKRLRFNEEDLEYCCQLVDRIAATLDNAQLLADLRRSEWHMRMLAELSRQFALSLDLHGVLSTVAAQVTEALADWCTIGLLNNASQTIHVTASYHRDTHFRQVLDDYASGQPIRTLVGVVGQVVHSQVPQMFDHPTEEQVASLLNDPENALITSFRPSSYICAPLTARGRPVGYIEFGCSIHGGRIFGPAEFLLIRELADRAASAIQNAQMYAELQDVLRTRDDWLSIASHELKTPLTPLQIQLQIMERRVRRSDIVSIEQIQRCLAQVDRLVKFINELLDVSRVGSGYLELHPEALELRPLVEEVAKNFDDSSELHQILLEPGGDGVWVLADRIRLEQVLVHIIHNAVKFSPEGGAVKVHVESDQNLTHPGVNIEVEDQGLGIPEHERPQLFQRYFRGTNASERNFGGLGLGLWMSQAIIERHHGKMHFRESEGGGSNFSIWLPISNKTHVEPREPMTTVLIIDDDVDTASLAREWLELAGYHVITTKSGLEALEVLKQERPRIVLLDLLMPLMDGWELMRRLRGLPHGDLIRVIAFSAMADLSARAGEIGAMDYLTKPYHANELLEKVARAAGRQGKGSFVTGDPFSSPVKFPAGA